MKRNFPDFIQAYLNYTRNHESTDKVQLWTILSVIAGALERKVWMDRGYYTLYPNLYVFIIGKSGLIKKSTSTSIGVSLLKEIEGIKFTSERLTAGSLIQQMSTAARPFFHKEKEVNQSPVFAYASELAVFMGEVYGSIIELLTTFYDCQPNDPSKPWVYQSKHCGNEIIYGPCLNILGASTKEWLQKCIPRSEHEGGFTSRCVFVVENEGPDKYVAWPEPPKNANEMKIKLIEDLAHIHSLVGQVQVTDKMRNVFSQWYTYHMKEIVPNNTDTRFTGYLSRKGDLLLKLSMIRSVSVSDELIITDEHFKWAGIHLEAIEADMMMAFNGTQPSPRSRAGRPPRDVNVEAYDVHKFLRSKNGPVSTEEVMKQFPGSRSAVMAIMDDLMGMGKVDFTHDNDTQYFTAK